jgi:hypothetical protein
MISLLALASCIRMEPALDNSTIEGTIQLPPTQIEETRDNANGTLANAVVLAPLSYGVTQLLGKTTGYGLNGDAFAPTSDQDWFLINPPPSFRDQGCTLDPYVFETIITGDTGASLPKSMETTFTLAIEDPSATLRVEILDLDVIVGNGPSEGPIVFRSEDITGTGAIDLCLMDGANYAIHIGGVTGTAASNWTLSMAGLHPEDAGLKVGAWLNDDVLDRGFPVGGTDVQDFTGGAEEDGWTWTGTYDIFLIRSVTTDKTGKKEKTTYDEAISETWLFAGDWASLNLPLPAGTWYSSKPVHVVLDKTPKSNRLDDNVVYSAKPLVVDSFAPLVIGQEFTEVEPNDADSVTYASWELDPADMANANDLGVLSAPGEVDILRGTTPFESDTADWVHDNDLFKFEVPETELLYFNLDWSLGDADLDAVIFDASGEPIDWMVTYDKPELGGGYAPFLPGEVYYLIIVPWIGPNGSTMDWELIMEGVSTD